MKLRHPLLLAAAALLFLSSSLPPLNAFYGIARTMTFIMTCMAIGVMIRVLRLHPVHRPYFWLSGLIGVIIFYNPIITPQIDLDTRSMLDMITAIFLAATAFLSPEALKKEKV